MLKMKLHILMAEHRMTQKEVAKQTGIHAPTINRYYHETFQKIDKDHISALCELFNCKIQDLLEFVPDKEESK